VIIADHQTVGRGRLGRSFHSPAGSGIYMSVILRPNCPAQKLMHLTCAAAVAMCYAVENAVGLRPGIKWTNDLVFGRKKAGGILTELGFGSGGTVSYAIVGIGINCTQTAEDFPEDIRSIATSLETVIGKPVDRAAVAAAMMEALYRMDMGLLKEKADTLNRYRRDCITIGQQISLLRVGEPVRHGTAIGMDDEGALMVEFEDGHRETVNSGEVSVRGMYGYV
jgi:BirA family biotin operon repressor/biotin-[acetyl-CoA-carboxylase] ligase